MATLTPFFSANRTVREYTEKYYLPGARRYAERAADKGAVGRKIVAWKRSIEERWPQLRFGEARTQTIEGRPSGETQFSFEVQLFTAGLPPEILLVELYAQGINDGQTFRQKLELHTPAGHDGMALYAGQVPGNRPAGDYTARVTPYLPEALVPLETARILWQR